MINSKNAHQWCLARFLLAGGYSGSSPYRRGDGLLSVKECGSSQVVSWDAMPARVLHSRSEVAVALTRWKSCYPMRA